MSSIGTSAHPGISLILLDIRSAENVGAIFRTADGAGAGKIYLAGYTPAPVDRFGRPDPKIAKTALGAEKTIPWERAEHVSALIRTLKEADTRIVAVEQSPDAVPYTEWKPQFPLALILGNEVEGVPKEVLGMCDEAVEIPMRGEKESLNVSVATGIILYKASESLTGYS